jgi:hypothetical protein
LKGDKPTSFSIAFTPTPFGHDITYIAFIGDLTMQRFTIEATSKALLTLVFISSSLFTACGLPEDPFQNQAPTHIISQTDTSFFKEGQTLFSAEQQNCQKTWQKWVTSCPFYKTIRIPVLEAPSDERSYTGSLMLSFTCHGLNNDAKLFVRIHQTSVSLSPKPVTQVVTYRTNGLDTSAIVPVELRGSWEKNYIISSVCGFSILTETT